MNVPNKAKGSEGKSLTFWLIYVVIPVLVIGLLAAGFYVYKGKRFLKKRGIEKGLIFANVHKNKEAIDIFKKELEKNPEDPNIHYYIGVSYFNLKEYDKAAEKFQTALKIKPDFPDAHLQLAVISLTKALELRNFGKSESLVLEKLLEAEEICREVIEKYPDNKHAYVRMGAIHSEQGMVEEAIADFEQALKLDSALIDAHISLANLYARSSELELAEKHCNKVLSEIDPDNYQTRLLLSAIYEQKGEHEKGVECLRHILKKQPEDLNAHIQLGLFYLKMSKYDEAYQVVEQVRALKPVILPPAINFIEATVLYQRKDYANAITLLKEVTKKIPKFIQSHYVLALALTESGRREDAENEFRTAINLDPKFIPAQLGLVRLLAMEGKYDETVKLCNEILKKVPGNVDVLQMLGTAYIQLKDFKSAEAVFQKIIEHNPTIGTVHMARLSFESGQLGKCVRQCEEIIKVNPDDVAAYDVLGLAYAKQGKLDNAIEQFAKAIEKNPGATDIHLKLAKVYLLKGTYNDAIKVLDNLISLNPESLQAYSLLASIYEKVGKVDKAIHTLTKLLEKNPTYLPGYQLASLYLIQGRPDEAIDLCNKALPLAPKETALYVNLAIAHQEKGEYQESISLCQKADKLNPGMPFTNILLTNIRIANGDISKASDFFVQGGEQFKRKEYDKAISSLREVTKRLPESSQAHYALANILTESFHMGEAREEFEATIDLAPKFVPAKLGLARLLLKEGSLNESIRLSKEILTIDSNSVDAMNIMGTAYMKLEDFKNAEVFFDKILELEPSFGTTHKAHLNLVTGALNRCIKQCEQILEADQDKPEAYEILGLAYLKRGDLEKAIELLIKCVERSPHAIDTLLNVAKLYVVTGGDDAAVKSLEELITQNPHHLQANSILANLYAKGGRIDEAADLFERVLAIDPAYLPGYQLALLRLWQGRAEESIELWNRALKLDPEDTSLHANLAVAYQQNGDYTASMSSGKRAADLDSKMPLFDIFMANLFVASGDMVKAHKQVESSSLLGEEVKREYMGLIEYFQNNKEDTKQVILAINRSIAARYRGYFSLEKGESQKVAAMLPENLVPKKIFMPNKDEEISTYQRMVDRDSQLVSERLALVHLHREKGSTEEVTKALEGVVDFYPENRTTYDLMKEFTETSDATTRTVSSKVPQFDQISPEKYREVARDRFAQEKVDSIPIFNTEEKEEYLRLIKSCQESEKRGGQVTLAINKSIVAIQNGFFELAVREAEKATKIFPENLIPKIFLASSYLSAGKKEEAIKTYGEIVEHNPKFVSKDLAQAYLLAEKEDDAIATYKNLVDMDSESVSARLTLAGLLLKKGSLDEAEKVVGEAIELAPENLTARNLLGELKLANTRYDSAETEFSKMLQLNSNLFEGHYNMARVKYAQDDIDECIRHCKSGIQINPTDVRLLNVLGAAYMKKGMLHYALAVFQKVSDIQTDFVPALLNSANIKLQLGEYDTAVEYYKDALKIDPDSKEARTGLGNAYALMGNHEDSIVEFETLKEADPDSVAIYFSLIRSYLALEEDDKALEATKKILELDSKNQIARTLLAKIYVKKGEIEKAIEQLKGVLADDPKSAEANGLGILFMDKGQYDESVSTYLQGVENFPNNVLLWCNLSVAYLMQKDFEGAMGASTQALKLQPNGFISNLCMVNTLISQGKLKEAELHIKAETLKVGNDQLGPILGLTQFCSKNSEVVAKIGLHLGRSLAYANNKWLKRLLSEQDEIAKLALPDASVYFTLANLLILAGGDEEAIAICKKAIDQEPESPYAYSQLAGIYQRKARSDEAIELYKKVTSLDPENTLAHMGLGMLLQLKGSMSESIKAYERVIELNPSSPSAYNNLAWLYATEVPDKKEYALELAGKAKKLAPKNAAIIDTYGWIYYLSGNYDKALSELKVAASGVTKDPTIHYHLGMAYYKKNLHVLALGELEQALRLSTNFPEVKEASDVIEKIRYYQESTVLGF